MPAAFCIKMSDETAVKMAQLLNVDESEVLLAAAIARSHGEVRRAWEKISLMTGNAAGIFFYFYTVTPYLENLSHR